MNKCLTFFLPVLLFSLLCSCTINGNLQGLFSYYNKTEKSLPGLLCKPAPGTSICGIRNSGVPRVYVIHAGALKDCLKSSRKAIIYIWSSRCRSVLCYSLNLVQERCNAKGIELFIVAEYYDDEFMNFNYNIEHPILGIDTKYYRTNFTSRYIFRFLNELASVSKFENRFFYFENGIIRRSFYLIEEIGLVE